MSLTLDQTNVSSKQKDINRFPKAKAIFNICAIVILMLVFNLYPDRIGIWQFTGDEISFYPLLNSVFLATWLPWFNIWWILALSLNIAHLSLGHWTLATRVLDIVVIVLGLNIILSLLFGSPMNAINPGLATADLGWTPVMREMSPMFPWIIPFILAIIAIAVGVDLIRKVIWLVRSVIR